MRYLIYIFLSQILFLKSFAQGNFEKYGVNVDIVAEPNVTSGDGGVLLHYNSPTDNNYKFKILARTSRNNKGKSDQYAEMTWLRLKYVTNGNTYVIANELLLNFVPDGLNQSPYKEFSIEIPSTIQTDGQIVGEFYNRNGASIAEVKNVNTPLITKIISGPSQICGEGIYSLGGPEAASLENASGIATLSSLGNNRWKITRIGSAEGTVYLTSTSNGKTFKYPVKVGSYLLGTIGGTITTKQGRNNNLYGFTPAPGTNYTNITWETEFGLITQQIDPYTFRIDVPVNFPLSDTFKGDDIYVTVRATGECGVMTLSKKVRVLPKTPIANP